MMRRLSTTLISCFVAAAAFAQDTGAVQNGQSQGFMHAGGKIGVVMAVCLTILVGLILYLVRLDRKISRLEKK